VSLCITLISPEGVVAAGESRTTQVLNNINRVMSDSAIKVFALTNRVVATTSGWAFVKAQASPNLLNIAAHVEQFKSTIAGDATTLDITHAMWTHFNALYDGHIAHYPGAALPAGQTALNFTVAGYNPDSLAGELFQFGIPSTQQPTTPQATSDNAGSWWIGATDVIGRIVNGFDERIMSLPFVQTEDGANNNAGAATNALRAMGYIINWQLMTLQDLIDFAVGMIQVTISVQRFTAGTFNAPGAAASVGGPIDVAVIRPGGTVEWVAQKTLHV
jgi:hypothetical protein